MVACDVFVVLVDEISESKKAQLYITITESFQDPSIRVRKKALDLY